MIFMRHGMIGITVAGKRRQKTKKLAPPTPKKPIVEEIPIEVIEVPATAAEIEPLPEEPLITDSDSDAEIAVYGAPLEAMIEVQEKLKAGKVKRRQRRKLLKAPD